MKRGVLEAGGLPMVFPTMSLGEILPSPSSMLFRNLMSMETEEMIRAQPMEGVVLIGCDKTLPAQLMGSISADRPAITLPLGAMMTGSYQGEQLGACTAQPLGTHVIAVTRSGRQVEGADECLAASDLHEVWSRVDLVVLAAPSTTETDHLIGATELAALPEHTVVVNIARGSLDTDALVDALLATGSIGVAALDVTDPEPLPDGHPLWTEPRALITPHAANPGPEQVPRLCALVVDNSTVSPTARPFESGWTSMPGTDPATSGRGDHLPLVETPAIGSGAMTSALMDEVMRQRWRVAHRETLDREPEEGRRLAAGDVPGSLRESGPVRGGGPLGNIARGAAMTLIESSLRWLLTWDHVDGVILGVSSIEQLESNIAAADGRGPDDDTIAAVDEVWADLRGAAPSYNR